MPIKLDQSRPFMKSPNWLERDLGEMTDEQRKLVTEILLTFMREIREIQQSSRGSEPKSGVTCESCAFNPSLDSDKGFLPTAYGLLKAICDQKLFVCHANQEGWKDNVLDTSKPVALCNGFKQVKEEERTFTAAEKAMQAIRETVPRN